MAESFEEIFEMKTANPGKFRILIVDKFSNESGVYGEYKTKKEAVETAEEKTRESMKYASDRSIATVFYAYDDKGKYLGGDVWDDVRAES